MRDLAENYLTEKVELESEENDEDDDLEINLEEVTFFLIIRALVIALEAEHLTLYPWN